jgi:flagellar protein FlbD
MIRLTRINHEPLVLNSDLIEHIETTPDTVISMTTGQKFMVLESPDEVIDRVILFRHSIGSCLVRRGSTRDSDEPAIADKDESETEDQVD